MSLEKDVLQPALEDSVPQEIFKAEVHSWAKKIGVQPKRITIREMKNKWSSCTNKGNLTFDTDLLHQTAEFRRKAIVHELLHFKYPNHGKMFRALERAYLHKG